MQEFAANQRHDRSDQGDQDAEIESLIASHRSASAGSPVVQPIVNEHSHAVCPFVG